jgi:hypothetical protein
MCDERRHIRFASINGIDRKELPIAAEVWIESINKSSWADREILKLANICARYMRDPQPLSVAIRVIEQSAGLDRGKIDNNLRLMVLYGAVETYDCGGENLRASLYLTYTQRLRVLEIRRRFCELHPENLPRALPWHKSEVNWLPQTVPANAEEDEAAQADAPKAAAAG